MHTRPGCLSIATQQPGHVTPPGLCQRRGRPMRMRAAHQRQQRRQRRLSGRSSCMGARQAASAEPHAAWTLPLSHVCPQRPGRAGQHTRMRQEGEQLLRRGHRDCRAEQPQRPAGPRQRRRQLWLGASGRATWGRAASWCTSPPLSQSRRAPSCSRRCRSGSQAPLNRELLSVLWLAQAAF